MSSEVVPTLGLSDADAAAIGADGATRVRTFRLLVLLAQELRTLMDDLLRPDGLTTQQAALVTVVEALGAPSLSQAARALGTTHQNARQIADALERKGFVRLEADVRDGRVRRLVATSRSRAFWARRSPEDQRRVIDWLSVLSPEEARTLLDLLLRVEAHVRGTLARRRAV
jgi:DNA-binding MarR family transcriptional regulator